MSRRAFGLGLLGLLSALILTSCGGAANAPESAPTAGTPAGGVTLKYLAGSSGAASLPLDQVAAVSFQKQTGITVQVVAGPTSATDRLAQYQQTLAAQSPDVDVYQIDVIWPGILAGDMIDLSPYIPKAQMASYFPAIVQNNTVHGKLVGVPYYTDAGLLFYRTDLLRKYGIAGPPQTWDDLEADARTIQAGERAVGDAKFWGFVWQGNGYEGLTCDALEWQASQGGGVIVDPDGKITIDNPRAAAALDRARGWINTISPPDVLNYQETDSRLVWQAGHAAFMRQWPEAYAQSNAPDPTTGKASPIAGKFDVEPLPAGTGPGARHADVLGGWQLAVSKYSAHPREAAQWVAFLAGRDHQKVLATQGSSLPTIKDLYTDPDVLAANPFFARIQAVLSSAVARPSTVTGDNYNEVSTAYFTAVHKVLTGESKAGPALTDLAAQFKAILK